MLRHFRLPVQQIGADHAQRRLFGEKGRRVLPGGGVDPILREAIVQEPPLLFVPKNAQRRVFLQLFPHRGFVDLKGAVRMG